MAYFLRAISRDSPQTQAKERFRLPMQRCFQSPLRWQWGMRSRMRVRILWQSFWMCCQSLCIYFLATSQALPNPTTRAGARVPERRPRYWPPPLIWGRILTLGFLRRQRAPIPLGPQILWPLMLSKSMFMSLTLTGILPTACAASVWQKMPLSRQIFPISLTGWMTPISLLTKIVLTQSTFSLDQSMVFLSRSRSRIPLFLRGRQVTLNPCISKFLQVSRMHLCSICVVMICFLSLPQKAASPFSTKLLDSVAPEVKMISLGSAPMRSAICSLPISIPLEVSQPYWWVFEWGLPQYCSMQGVMASTTRQSMGVVAWQSRQITLLLENITLPTGLFNRGWDLRSRAQVRDNIYIIQNPEGASFFEAMM